MMVARQFYCLGYAYNKIRPVGNGVTDAARVFSRGINPDSEVERKI